MKDAHFRSRRTLARAVMQHFSSEYTSVQLTQMDEMIAEADRWEAAKGVDANGRKIELTDVKWEKVAKTHAHELYLPIPTKPPVYNGIMPPRIPG